MGSSSFFLATATSKRLLCRLCYCFLWPMRKHLTGSSYITGTPFPHLHLVQTPPNVIMCVWAAPISISTTLKKRCKFQSLFLSCTIHVGMLELIQWNLLILTPVGPKNFARLLGWPYYREGSNAPYIAFTLVEQLFSLMNNWSIGIVYSNCKNYLKVFFSTKSTFKNWLLNHHKCILIVL